MSQILYVHAITSLETGLS